MITTLLFHNIADFTVYTLSAFVFLSAGLLFIDSWILDKNSRTLLFRAVGFILLAIVHAFYASAIQIDVVSVVMQIIKTTALLLLLGSLLAEPILHKPVNDKLQQFNVLPFRVVTLSLIPISAVLYVLIALRYFRRSFEGLDKQLRPAFLAFLFLAVSELIKVSFAWSDSSNVFVSSILARYSVVWYLHQVFLLAGVLILGIWVWGYTRFRLQIQMFTIILASVFSIFISTTLLYSTLLIKNLEEDTISHLYTDSKVFQYTLERLQLESLSHASSIAGNPEVLDALKANDAEALYQRTSQLLIEKNISSLVIATNSGNILMRAEDKENLSGSILDGTTEPVFAGEKLSTLIVLEEPTQKSVHIQSAVPIILPEEKDVAWIVIVGMKIDDAFVDGIKDVTGLDMTVFAGNQRSASTLTGEDGISRFSGTLVADNNIEEKVLTDGENFFGNTEVFNTPYYAAYTPLKAYGGDVIGMLFIGKPQQILLTIAQRSIDITFLGSIILMALSIIPSYFLSKYIREHIQA